MNSNNEPVFFEDQDIFRDWLEKNHANATELYVGFYKIKSGKPCMTWSESVDQAICFGWIDGVKRSIDHERYQIRFSPRKKTSIWSAVNIKKVEILTKRGLMHKSGLDIFAYRKEKKSKVYSFENDEMELTHEFKNQFKANTKAWQYFETLATSYRKSSLNWVMTAKQKSTQLKRLHDLIADSELGINKWKDNKYNKKK